MPTDGTKQYYTDLADKNLGQTTAAADALRKMKEQPDGHSRADVDREERALKDAAGRLADAVRVLVDVGD